MGQSNDSDNSSSQEQDEFLIRVSFVEIHKEKVIDLLSEHVVLQKEENNHNHNGMNQISKSIDQGETELRHRPGETERERRRRTGREKRARKKRAFQRKQADVGIDNENENSELDGNKNQNPIRIKDDGRGNVHVTGCRRVTVRTASELHSQLFRGTLARTTGTTKMNSASSRSHAIFTVFVDRKIKSVDAEDESASTKFSSAKLHLVDLAGAERQKRTGATGARFKESVRINQGLLALGNVISALGDDKRNSRRKKRGQSKQHVPYRESKLTRFLQDSLGGNARTLMLACVSPSDDSFEETLNVLRYANRAKNIKNCAIKNLNVDDDKKRKELERLMNNDNDNNDNNNHPQGVRSGNRAQHSTIEEVDDEEHDGTTEPELDSEEDSEEEEQQENKVR